MLRNLFAKLKPLTLYVPQTLSASSTTSSVDLQDFGSVMLLVHAGAMAFSGSNKLDLIVQESDDGTVFTPSTDVLNAESGTIAKALDSTDDQNAIHAIHYTGHKRYIHLSMVETGTVSVPLGVSAIAGHPEFMPPL